MPRTSADHRSPIVDGPLDTMEVDGLRFSFVARPLANERVARRHGAVDRQAPHDALCVGQSIDVLDFGDGTFATPAWSAPNDACRSRELDLPNGGRCAPRADRDLIAVIPNPAKVVILDDGSGFHGPSPSPNSKSALHDERSLHAVRQPASLYTGKARSYLRTQGIPFVERSPGSDRYLNEIVPTVGRWIIPCMETPDGTIIQDGADIIDHFERGPGQSLRRYVVVSDSPLLACGRSRVRAVRRRRPAAPGHALPVELRRAEPGVPHLRVRTRCCRRDLHSRAGRTGLPPQQRPDAQGGSGFGVTPESQPLIETAFHEWLDLFEAHLVDHPYLLGNRPTIGDYGLIAAMWAHLLP